MRAGELVENALVAIATGLVAQGVGRLIVTGGETSGTVSPPAAAKTSA